MVVVRIHMEFTHRVIQRLVSVANKQSVYVINRLTESLSLYSRTPHIDRVPVSMCDTESVRWILHSIPVLFAYANLDEAKILGIDVFYIQL